MTIKIKSYAELTTIAAASVLLHNDIIEKDVDKWNVRKTEISMFCCRRNLRCFYFLQTVLRNDEQGQIIIICFRITGRIKLPKHSVYATAVFKGLY